MTVELNLQSSSLKQSLAVDHNKALWHDNATQSSLRAVETVTETGLVAITAHFSMVSTGSERLVCCGAVDADFAARMSVQHQQGGFSLPIKYGYSLVGHTQDQRLVHLMHPHQCIAYAKTSELYYLPEGLRADSAALISNMETVVNGIWDSELFFDTANLSSQHVAIVGFGNIGALLALTLRKVCGVNPVIIEINAWRREKAKSLGFTVNEPQSYSQATTPQSFNLLFHSTGSEEGLNYCLANAELEGVVIDLSWYGARLINLCLGREFHYQRIRLIGSQVSQIPKHKSQHSYATRKQYCAELLLDPIYDAVISDRIPFQDSPDFFHKLRNNTLPEGLIWLFDYGRTEQD